MDNASVEPSEGHDVDQDDRASISEALRRLHICRGRTGDTIREALPVIDRRIRVKRHDIPEPEAESCSRAACGTLGECVLPGSSDREIVLAAPTNEPTTNNHDLSGLALLTVLCEWLASTQRRFTYRAIFAPAALSVRTSLRLMDADLARIQGGMACYQLGGAAPLSYQRSSSCNSLIDRVVERVTADPASAPAGGTQHDAGERALPAGGLDARVGALRRSRCDGSSRFDAAAEDWAVSERELTRAFTFCKQVIEALETGSQMWMNLAPYGEPCLGKRDLYHVSNPRLGPGEFHMAMLWVLNLSDGGYSLLDIAERSGLELPLLAEAAGALWRGGLLAPYQAQDADAAIAAD